MEQEMKDYIRGFIVLQNEDAIQELFDGWETYFTDMRIDQEKQRAEFDGIIRARIPSGSISLVAPVKGIDY